MLRSVVLLLAALGFACAGDAVVAGPWLLVGEGEALEVGVELTASGGPAPRVVLQRNGSPLDIPVVLRPLARPRQVATLVASLRLDAPPVAGGTCALVVDGVPHPIVLPTRPSSSATVRMAIAGARNWPSPSDLERLATALGGPVSVVVAVGDDVAGCLGRGGWESAIPVLPLVPRAGGGTDTQRAERLAVDAALWGPALGWWPAGAVWGMLGLPTGGDEDQARSAMARDLSPWLVHVARNMRWDPALTVAGHRGRMADLAPLVGYCQRFNVPVVLACDGHAGWISEPMAVEQGRILVRAEGTRFIGATPAGDPLASLPDGIALAIERPALVGLAAVTGELLVAQVGLGGDLPVQILRYGLSGADRRRQGSGWGLADAEACRATWVAGGAPAVAALEDLSWAASPVYSRLRLGNDDFARLLGAASSDAVALRLLRRLVAVDNILRDHITPALPQVPPLVIRDLVLRQIARPRLAVAEVAACSAPVVSGDDAALIRAVLAAATDGGDQVMLGFLVSRLQNQAAGTLPLEADPILQHRILCAVFDADTLSPTPLRAIALALRDKVDALGKGPVERLLKRVGEKRPMGP